MAFFKITSPHAHSAGTTGTVMQRVILASIPGIIVLTFFFGYGTLVNILLASFFCIAFEAIVLKLRGRNIQYYLNDYSALVTALLLGISLPPYAPWWLIATGCFFAIVIAKQLYGGLGFNPFNPAMVGYVVLLISFPVEMTQWISPLFDNNLAFATLQSGLTQTFFSSALSSIDGLTAATPLDIVKNNPGLLLTDLYAQTEMLNKAQWAGKGWEWANLAFLVGGIYLLYKRAFTWHAPVGFLVSLIVCSALLYDGGSSQSPGSPIFHLLSGATMFGAFFIITDPVTSTVSTKGRLIYGACIGDIGLHHSRVGQLSRRNRICCITNEFRRAFYRLLHFAAYLWPAKVKTRHSK